MDIPEKEKEINNIKEISFTPSLIQNAPFGGCYE
jgi:hypothetical protein